MNQDATELSGAWTWGAVWVFYAYFYGRYFGHVARRLKPDLNYVTTPGSPERLYAKQRWCYRFAGLMLAPTLLESIRSSWFTTGVISLLPCGFGLWVMHAVWREVFRSELPQANRSKQTPQR